jgi:hypothetical protein
MLKDYKILWYDTKATTLTLWEQMESDLSSSVVQFYKSHAEAHLALLH